MLRRALIGLLAVVAVAAGLAVAARFHDGPLGPFPGGPMRGETVREPVADWSSVLAGTSRLELQVDPRHPRSVTTTYILHDGALYVPSVLAARKSWPAHVMADGRVVVRVHGRLYERRAVRVTDPAEIRALAREWDPKTPDDLDVGTLSTWYFRLEPRAP
ncbi:MAG TPA: hypothetical protein VGK30_17855 [Candidatus Binatia bacterium]|jgi:hypothetical protein